MAFFNAVYKNIHKEGGYNVEPKIVYRYGYVDGKFFDPWEETFENSIQKPVFRKQGEYTGIDSPVFSQYAPTSSKDWLRGTLSTVIDALYLS